MKTHIIIYLAILGAFLFAIKQVDNKYMYDSEGTRFAVGDTLKSKEATENGQRFECLSIDNGTAYLSPAQTSFIYASGPIRLNQNILNISAWVVVR